MSSYVPPGVSPDIAAERDTRRIENQAQLRAYAHQLTDRQQRTPGILFPVYKLGEDVPYTYVLRPDHPRMAPDGKDIKYEWPAGVPSCFDVLPRFRDALQDPTRELWITEGAKKADALASADATIVPVNIHGVWNWKHSDAPIADLDAIAWKGRAVVLAFDSDVVEKSSVQQALKALAKQLRKRGALVRVLVLPGDDAKLGVDDALFQGMTMTDLRENVCVMADLPKPARPDAEDAAVQLAADHRDQLAYDVDLDSFRIYHPKHAWQPISDHDLTLDRWIVEAMTACELKRSKNMRDNVLYLARRHMVRTFTAQAGLIAFTNGTLDVATGTLHAHDPADGLTFCLPYPWQPTSLTPTIDTVLKQTVPDELARHAFQTHAGLALLGDTRFQHALLLLGAPNTGKTTVLRLFNRLVGQPADQFAPGEIFRAEREGSLQRAECRNWRGVALDEFPSDVLKDEEPFKKMTAHSGIDSRQHQKAPVNMQWLPKIVLAANDVPRFRDPSGALARRLLVLSCPTPVDHTAIDLQIDDRMIEELPGFAAQCLAAARAAQATGGYPISEGMRVAFDEVATEGDALKSFVAECCLLTVQTGNAHDVLSSTIYKKYKDWCEDNGNHPLSNNALSRRLRDYAPWKITKQRTMQGAALIGIAVHDGSGADYDGFPKNRHMNTPHQDAINQRWYDGYDGYDGFLEKTCISVKQAIPQAIPLNNEIVRTLEKNRQTVITVINRHTEADDTPLVPVPAVYTDPLAKPGAVAQQWKHDARAMVERLKARTAAGGEE